MEIDPNQSQAYPAIRPSRRDKVPLEIRAKQEVSAGGLHTHPPSTHGGYKGFRSRKQLDPTDNVRGIVREVGGPPCSLAELAQMGQR